MCEIKWYSKNVLFYIKVTNFDFDKQIFIGHHFKPRTTFA